MSDQHCTHLPHGDQLSPILSWTGPQHLLHTGEQCGLCPVVAHVGIQSASFCNTHREQLYWVERVLRQKASRFDFSAGELFYTFPPSKFPPKGSKQYQVRVNDPSFIDISMSMRKSPIQPDNSKLKTFLTDG